MKHRPIKAVDYRLFAQEMFRLWIDPDDFGHQEQRQTLINSSRSVRMKVEPVTDPILNSSVTALNLPASTTGG